MINDSFKHDPSVQYTKMFGVPYGTQVILSLQDCKAAIIVVNPSDGRKPYLRYLTKDIDNTTTIEREGHDDSV